MAVRDEGPRLLRRTSRATVTWGVLVVALLVLGTSCSVGSEAGDPGDASSVEGSASVGFWVPVEERWSRAGVFVELLDGGEFRGDDACKPLGGRWEVTPTEQVRVEVGPTSGLACDFRFPLIDLLQEPLELTSTGERLVLNPTGPEPVELVRASGSASEASSDDALASASSQLDLPANPDASGVIAVAGDDGAGAFVLVASESNAEEALVSGAVKVVDGCLGVGDSVVLWPPGTLVTSEYPLTVGIPGFGVATVGDMLAVSGGFHTPSIDTAGRETVRGTSVPSACRGRTVFHSGMVTEVEERSGRRQPSTIMSRQASGA